MCCTDARKLAIDKNSNVYLQNNLRKYIKLSEKSQGCNSLDSRHL